MFLSRLNSLIVNCSSFKCFCVLLSGATLLSFLVGTLCYQSVIGAVTPQFYLFLTLMMLFVAGPLIGLSVHTIKSLVASHSHQKKMRKELNARVTELDSVRSRLTDAHAQLETRVRQRTVELEEAKHSAEAANRAKTQFLSNISHELRTPLNAVLGFSDLLVRHHAEKDTPTDVIGADYAQTIHESGSHLLMLVNDLIDLAKIEAGRIDVEIEPINLHSLLSGVVRMMEPQLDAKSLSVVVAGHDPGLTILADRRAQKQVFFSILTRALALAPADSAIHVEIEPQDGFATMRVRHPGPPMTAEEIERALEPFAQLSAPQISRGESMTLALAISRALMQLQGGTLDIVSDAAGSATIALRFATKIALADAETG